MVEENMQIPFLVLEGQIARCRKIPLINVLCHGLYVPFLGNILSFEAVCLILFFFLMCYIAFFRLYSRFWFYFHYMATCFLHLSC